MNILNELKRRNVFRVAAAYLVVSWLIIQVVSILSPLFDVSVGFQRGIVLLLLVAFIPILFFTWAYEITAEGIKKEAEIERDASLTAHTAKKLNIITLIAVVAAGGMFVFQQISSYKVIESESSNLVENNETELAASAGIQADNIVSIPDESIAVLPFVNMSSDAEQEYFSDGITEEILNALAKIKQLKVAGRTSSFSFKGKNEDLRVVGDTLGVAHILEGSVRKAGNQVRITAQLIKVDDGFHMWSETYDGSLENVFDLQEDISRKVSDELKLVLNIQDGIRLASKMTNNVDAYDLFLRGRELVAKRIDGSIPKGILLLKNAVELDPQFAEAWAVLAEAEAVAGAYVGYTSAESKAGDERAQSYIKTAIAIDPTLLLPYAIRGLLKVNAQEQDYLGAIDDMQKALELEPNNVLTLRWLGNDYQSLGYFEKAHFLYNHAFELEPLSRTEAFNLVSNKLHTGDLEAAKEYSQKVNALAGFINDDIAAYILSVQGNHQAAITLFMQYHQQEVERLGANELVTHDEARQFAQAAFGGNQEMKKSVQNLGKLFINGPDDSFYWQLNHHIVLENYDRVFEILANKPDFFITFATDFMWYDLPSFKAFRKDPRFALMLERYGFVKAWNELGWPDICKPHKGTDGNNGRFSCE